MKEGKPIGVFPLCNTGGIEVYAIEDDRVLASMNGGKKEWCKVTEMPRCECGGDEKDVELEQGFLFGSFFVPFDEVMKI